MTTRPITFSGPMVRAILAGRKTQTRRILKLQPPQDWKPLPYLGELHRMKDGEPVEPRAKRDILGPGWTEEDGWRGFLSPCAPDDRLWVREAWKVHAEFDRRAPKDIPQDSDIQYLADKPVSPWDSRTRAAMFMPRWASRITLIVTDVRVQRIQEISGGDVRAEGIYERSHVGDDPTSPEWT